VLTGPFGAGLHVLTTPDGERVVTSRRTSSRTPEPG
jgi:hypothetical protein